MAKTRGTYPVTKKQGATRSVPVRIDPAHGGKPHHGDPTITTPANPTNPRKRKQG